MAQNLIDKLELEAFRKGITPRTKESMQWFRKRAQQLRRVNRRELMQSDPLELKSRPIRGSMFMFFYDPKYKATLPYYDRFPLIIMMGREKGGFAGFNLHYLPPVLRAKFLDQVTNDDQINLRAIARSPYFAPCYKRYLTAHLRSRFAYVPPPEWEIASFLPTADFEKATKNQVYAQSRRMIR